MVAGVNASAAANSGDRVNSVVFSYYRLWRRVRPERARGNALLRCRDSSMIEMDVLFNRAVVCDSYRGSLRFPPVGGIAIGDIRRVFLHEVGHGIGLNHPDQAGQNVQAVMNAMISDLEVPAQDDTAGCPSTLRRAEPSRLRLHHHRRRHLLHRLRRQRAPPCDELRSTREHLHAHEGRP